MLVFFRIDTVVVFSCISEYLMRCSISTWL